MALREDCLSEWKPVNIYEGPRPSGYSGLFPVTYIAELPSGELFIGGSIEDVTKKAQSWISGPTKSR